MRFAEVGIECQRPLERPRGVGAAASRVQRLPEIEDEAVVRIAPKAYEKGVDFADTLHAATSAGTSRFVTFDSRLAKRAARAPPRARRWYLRNIGG
jgi:predicted nucleic acid-binding protein